MKYLFLNTSDMTDGSGVYHYNGLDTNKFVDIRYNEDATQAVVKTTQIDVPEHIQQITETEYNSYAEQWPEPAPPQSCGMDYKLITLEQQLQSLKEYNLILMDALATTFEEILTLRAIVEGKE